MKASGEPGQGGECVVRVRVFARLRDILGTDALDVSAPCVSPGKTTVGLLRQAIGAVAPELGSLNGALLFAVGTEYADDTTVVASDDDVACFPPVSGG